MFWRKFAPKHVDEHPPNVNNMSKGVTYVLGIICYLCTRLGNDSRLWRLKVAANQGFKAPKARAISAWGEAPGNIATKIKG